jgi:hypothetical protein
MFLETCVAARSDHVGSDGSGVRIDGDGRPPSGRVGTITGSEDVLAGEEGRLDLCSRMRLEWVNERRKSIKQMRR